MRVLARNALLVGLVTLGCADDRAPGLAISTLSPAGARHLAPQYSPDGKRIAWWAPVTDSIGGWELWVGNADLTSSVKLPVTAAGGGPFVWSPDGSRIAAASSQFGAAHTVVVPVSGGEAKRVTRGAGVDAPVAWYPDGDRLAYHASAEGGTFTSFVVSTQTGVSTPAVAGEKRRYFAVPSPEGAHIAYQVSDGASNTIWLVDTAGRARQLTTEGFESISQTSWSPDGKELLYQSRRTGTADLWVIPIDGKPARQLTRDVRNDFGGSWTSDGKWVAFVSERGRQTDVWVVPAAGGVERRITDTPAIEYTPARWRPGTHELTFVAEHVQSGVWALDIANGAERRLTPDSIRVASFFVSPDGRQIAYTIFRGGGVFDLAVMPVAGGGSRVLLEGGGTVNQPRWSPDGSKLVFQSDRGGTNDIWVIDVAGGAPRQLVNWPGGEYSARWNADGSGIFFISDRDARVGDVWKVPALGGEPTRVTRNGSVGNSIVTRTGVTDIFVGTVNPVGGQLSYSRVRPDGSMNTVWGSSTAFVTHISPSGDSLTALVEQPDGKMRSMIISASGGGGRVILKSGEADQWLSDDGSTLIYTISARGAIDLGVLRVADGTTRRLTTTPEDEFGAELTPDGKTVLFRRTKIVQRIYSADLSKVLEDAK